VTTPMGGDANGISGNSRERDVVVRVG